IQSILIDDAAHVTYYISGLTAIEYFYAAYMQDDFKAFMPFLFLMIIVAMYLSFRSIKLTVLPLLSIMVSVACSMALLHLMGFSVNNVTTIIPPILMAIMIADSVHVIGEALERKRKSEGLEGDFLKVTMKHLMFPCFLTTTTTAVGFWSLSLSEIPPVRQLGIVVGFGVFIALILTFTFLPACAKKWRVFRVETKASREGSQDYFENILTRVSEINKRYYKTITVLSIFIVGISVWGVSKIQAETSVIEYFRKSTPIYKSTIFIEKNLSGVHTLNISLRSDEVDYFKNPQALKTLEEITGFLHGIPEVDKVSSVNDYMKEINKSFHNEDPEFYRLPDNRRMVSQYVLLYGRDDLEDFMDDQWQWATIRVRLKEHSTVKLSGVIGEIQEYVQRYRKDFSHVRTLGQTVLEVEANNTVSNGQMKSLGLAMLVIFGMMFLVFRSLPVGLVSVIPNVLPILMNFGLMGFCGIRLDSATSMIAAVGIGIVVDDTI
ncbi:MAG: MMPL family transporter, partial [Candidatus Heimdallarchaeota archaeon]|nr:MMPL family transporter [Candidatus Heimdallarchaeota archaeon]